jgi:hypothetical protein
MCKQEEREAKSDGDPKRAVIRNKDFERRPERHGKQSYPSSCNGERGGYMTGHIEENETDFLQLRAIGLLLGGGAVQDGR